MATKIIHKKSTVASKVPLDTDLEQGELAINLTDQKIYSKNGSGNIVVVGEVNSTASEILTAIKTVDGSGSGLDADLLDGVHGSSYLRSDSNDTTSANLGGGLDSALYGFVLPQNPEGKHIKSPFFFNDIAYSRIRGATVSVDVDGTPMTSTTAIDAMFNASGDFWNMATAGVTTATITVTNAPKTLTYGSYIGISFGNTHWRAKSVTLQYSTDGGTNWTTARAVTNQAEEYVVAYFGMGAGVSASAFRWILSDFNTTSMRVASLFAYNYNSGGMKDLYVSRDGGSIHSDISISGNIAVSGTVDGRNVAADGTKLDGIEAGATADQTASEILTAIKTVDGAGSGLDADTLDGQHASAFLTGNQTITLSGDLSGSGTTSINAQIEANAVGASELNVTGNGTAGQYLTSDGDGSFSWATGGGLFGGDAGTLDGLDSSQFLRSDAADTKTSGDLGFSDNVKATFGASSDLQIYHDGSNSYIDDTGTGNLQIRGNNLYLQKYTGENYLRALADGALNLYYNNSSKLATTSTGVSVTGNIAVSGTVDGRDVASDGTKLDGIEAGADVTDATNVAAAGAAMTSGATFTGAVDFGAEIVETTYSLTGTALDPANGTVQYKTLSANTTLTDSLSDGEAITLMIDDGAAYTITWPTITWVNNGGAAPTLATTGYTVVAIWKVSTTLYGALVGDGS